MKTERSIAAAARRSGRARSGGFTIVELLVTMAVLAIVLGLAVPSFNDMMLASKLRSVASEFAMSSRLARSEARNRNRDITLCVSTDGQTCTGGAWTDGWIVFEDEDGDGAIDAANDREKLIHRGARAPNGFALTEASAASSIMFSRTNFGGVPADLTVSRVAPPDPRKHRVCISATGSTSVKNPTPDVPEPPAC